MLNSSNNKETCNVETMTVQSCLIDVISMVKTAEIIVTIRATAFVLI